MLEHLLLRGPLPENTIEDELEVLAAVLGAAGGQRGAWGSAGLLGVEDEDVLIHDVQHGPRGPVPFAGDGRPHPHHYGHGAVLGRGAHRHGDGGLGGTRPGIRAQRGEGRR